MRRFWILFFVLLFIFANSALAERTVYADQGGVAVFMEDGKVGLVNVEGEVILPAEYEWIEPFAGRNVAIVHREDRTGLVRRDGAIVIPCEMRRLSFLEDSDFDGLPEYSDKRSYPNKFFIRRMPENAGECRRMQAQTIV